MGMLSVNLKHLYQRRSMWLVYVVVGLLALSFGGRWGVCGTF